MSLENYRIRELQSGDYNKDYLGLLKQHYTLSDISQDFFDKQLNNVRTKTNHHIRVVEEISTSKIVATGSVYIEFKFAYNLGKVGYIDDIVVDIDNRNKGIGHMLLTHLKKLALANGCVYINVIASESNEKFLLKAGFNKDKNHYSLKL
jgi:glucosamine-phosphate N-acetyltransferase